MNEWQGEEEEDTIQMHVCDQLGHEKTIGSFEAEDAESLGRSRAVSLRLERGASSCRTVCL